MKHFDLVAALLVLTAGLVLSVWSRRRIAEIERPKHIYFEDVLSSGVAGYDITSNQKCVGYMDLEIISNQSITISVSGLVRTVFNRAKANILFKAKAMFNPIGQLTESSFGIVSDKIRLQVKTEGIHPIEARTTAIGLGKDLSFSSSLEGPVIISEYKPGFFRIEYSNSADLDLPLIQQPLRLLKKTLALKISQRKSPDDSCLKQPESRLPLNDVVKSFAGMLKGSIFTKGLYKGWAG